MKKGYKNKKINIKRQGGFSLLEMIIALFIFSLIIITSVAVFSSLIGSRGSAKKIQEQTELARIALDTMAKNMRMSSELKASGNNQVYMYNNGQDLCVRYQFSSGSLLASQAPPAAGGSTNCSPANVSYGTSEALVSGSASGGFEVVETDSSGGNKKIGRATIRMTISGSVNIQTTVSFRDYQGIIQ